MRFGKRVAGDDLIDTYEKTRGSGFGAEVKRRVLIGTYVLSAGYYDAYYLRAQRVRTRIAEDFKKVFSEVDALLTPTTPSAAFALGEKSGDPVEMYLNDIFTVTANLAGIPGLSLPAGIDANGLPLGLQVLGRALDEETVFAVASAIEKAADFKARPDIWWA
jgi:aspartyl-tRNA(Asn)/glutamyl-tRNA(Gln) amidotransferase subunit A